MHLLLPSHDVALDFEQLFSGNFCRGAESLSVGGMDNFIFTRGCYFSDC